MPRLRTITACAALALSLACGGSESSGPVRPSFRGEVTLIGELAGVTEGLVFVSARAEGSRMPIYTKKILLSEFRPRPDGARVAAYTLTEADFMGGVELLIPKSLELQIKYDPDGQAETFDGVETVVLPVTPGRDTYSVELRRGMPRPDQPPSAFGPE